MLCCKLLDESVCCILTRFVTTWTSPICRALALILSNTCPAILTFSSAPCMERQTQKIKHFLISVLLSLQTSMGVSTYSDFEFSSPEMLNVFDQRQFSQLCTVLMKWRWEQAYFIDAFMISLNIRFLHTLLLWLRISNFYFWLIGEYFVTFLSAFSFIKFIAAIRIGEPLLVTLVSVETI